MKKGWKAALWLMGLLTIVGFGSLFYFLGYSGLLDPNHGFTFMKIGFSLLWVASLILLINANNMRKEMGRNYYAGIIIYITGMIVILALMFYLASEVLQS